MTASTTSPGAGGGGTAFRPIATANFCVPAVTATIQDRLTNLPEVDKGKTPSPVTLDDGSVLAGAVTGNPRMGGPVWFGEDDAHDAVVEAVEAADGTGQLRSILDAIRSHRIEDDFSSRWSYARGTSNASCTESDARSR
jgi:hypothetical protein